MHEILLGYLKKKKTKVMTHFTTWLNLNTCKDWKCSPATECLPWCKSCAQSLAQEERNEGGEEERKEEGRRERRKEGGKERRLD